VQQGFIEAQFELGGCYHNGNGVERKNRQALQVYAKSATQGNIFTKASPDALVKNLVGWSNDSVKDREMQMPRMLSHFLTMWALYKNNKDSSPKPNG
jgi:TPR repeat protein